MRSRTLHVMTDALAGVFDRASPTYDQVGVELFGPVAQLLVDALDPRPGEAVLDVGCGRGAFLLRAAALAGRADGLDLSPLMVQAARAAGRDLHVDVRVGDATAPDLPPGSYDVVGSSLVLFFLPDPVAALRAWRHLLAGGGRLGVTTFGSLSPAWDAVEQAVMARGPAGMRDPRTVGPASPFGSDAGVEALLVEAGLRDVRTVSATVPVRFDDADHWYRWSWSVAQRRVWEPLTAAERSRLRAEVEDLLEATRQADGRLGFDQVARATLGRR